MKIFGIEVLVDQGDLVVLGRLSVAFLLVLFLLHGLSSFLALISRFVSDTNDRQEAVVNREVQEIEDEMRDPDGYHQHHEPEPWDQWAYDKKVKRSLRLNRVSRVASSYDVLKEALINFGLVILTALVAAYRPTLLSQLLAVIGN
jgi:hypothetical protein